MDVPNKFSASISPFSQLLQPKSTDGDDDDAEDDSWTPLEDIEE